MVHLISQIKSTLFRAMQYVYVKILEQFLKKINETMLSTYICQKCCPELLETSMWIHDIFQQCRCKHYDVADIIGFGPVLILRF